MQVYPSVPINLSFMCNCTCPYSLNYEETPYLIVRTSMLHVMKKHHSCTCTCTYMHVSMLHVILLFQVMGLLNHIKKRLDSRPIIQLPMTSLMNILKSSSSSMIIKVISHIHVHVHYIHVH